MIVYKGNTSIPVSYAGAAGEVTAKDTEKY